MLYQNLLMDEYPYYVILRDVVDFQKHRHPDIEIDFCLEGSYAIKIDNKDYHMTSGDLAISLPMHSHEIVTNGTPSKALTIVVGPTLLGDYFKAFHNSSIKNFHFHLSPKDHKELVELLKETAELKENPTSFSELTIKGNIYKICSFILERFISSESSGTNSDSLRSVANVERALELIHHNYSEDIKIEEVAEMCGYSKSNFCKIFKNITGNTFHNVLNHHRINIACNLLKETNYSVEDISQRTGFSDSKSLCRVFKNTLGCTPGEYRKKEI